MKEFIQSHVSFKDAILIIFTLLLLIVFCQVVGFSLIIPFLLLFLGVQIFFLQKADYRLFLQLGLLLSLNVAGTNYLMQHTSISPFFVPVAAFSMLVILLYNDTVLAFIMAFLTSVITSLLLNNSLYAMEGRALMGSELEIMLIFFLGSLAAVYTVKEARTRGSIIATGIYVAIIQVVAFLLFHHETDLLINREFYSKYIYPLAINGVVSSFVVMATLKVFETWFGVLTNFSLLELTDFNQPLLKRMILEAPGTYHHSLVVSNIAEAASDAVGANALLTRVGAYYHDVGKMVKPEYFTENQQVGRNKHDFIEPNVSRLVILNHVKEGLELAKKYKLNPVIYSFIVQHHGTGLMYYFYQRALEDAEDQTSVKEEAFRYPGPKPQSKETAIVLLADSAEAATRSLDDPTPKKIEELVRKIINNKFIDGQLDECDLTLKEIELIAQSFTRVLSAMYHSRVKYPEKKNGSDSRNQKSAEKNPPPPPSGRPNHQDGSAG